jgi:hypothetical protein
VNIYAEAVWNFGPACLLWFVPLLLVGARLFDTLLNRRIASPGVRWFVCTGLFFFFMGGVGLVNASTYILWIFLFGLLLDRLARMPGLGYLGRRVGTPPRGRTRSSAGKQRVPQDLA